MKRTASAVALMLFVVPLLGCVGPSLIRASLDHGSSGVGRLVTAREMGVTVAVRDERPADAILGGGILGPRGEEGQGLFLGYVPERAGEVAELIERGAKEAVDAVGLKAGPGARLDVAVKAFRIDMFRYSGFAPMNCIGYGHIETTLTPAGGGEPMRRTFELAYFERTTPVMSMKEVAREAVSWIFVESAWEATVATLLVAYPGAADPAEVRRLLAIADGKEEIRSRQAIFWLGLVGRDDPLVREKLLALFHSAPDGRVRQASAEAIGMLGIEGAREEMEAMLAGTRKVAGWDMTDAEPVWYLMKALHGLRVRDLAARIPSSSGLRPRSRLVHLARFLETGEIPPLTPAEQQDLEKARQRSK